MHVVHHLDTGCWRDFVENHPQGSVFHTPEMFQVFARTKGHQPTLWATVDNEGRVLALMLPVQISLFDGFLRHLTTRAVAYGGVLCADCSEGREGLALLLRSYAMQPQGNPLFTELRNLSDLSDVQPLFDRYGFALEGHLNYLIELDQSEQILWRKISKSAQQRVRSSRNKGVVVEEVTERARIAVAYRLLQAVYTRVQVPLTHISLFEAAYDLLAPQGMFKIFFARLDDHYIGVRVLLMHKGKIIDWYAGDDRAFSSYSPNEFLVWHTCQWGQAHGFHLFDFGGAGKADEAYGPREFKAKFGGTLVNYGRNTIVHAPLRLKLSHSGYQLMRRFF